jgi:hypothetical protein
MDFKPQDLIRYLLASGGAVPEDKRGIYLLFEEANELIEKLWTGSEIGDQDIIASDVRKNTSTLYLLNETKASSYITMHTVL